MFLHVGLSGRLDELQRAHTPKSIAHVSEGCCWVRSYFKKSRSRSGHKMSQPCQTTHACGWFCTKISIVMVTWSYEDLIFYKIYLKKKLMLAALLSIPDCHFEEHSDLQFVALLPAFYFKNLRSRSFLRICRRSTHKRVFKRHFLRSF